jgi:hypothetical protein
LGAFFNREIRETWLRRRCSEYEADNFENLLRSPPLNWKMKNAVRRIPYADLQVPVSSSKKAGFGVFAPSELGIFREDRLDDRGGFLHGKARDHFGEGGLG